MPFIFWLWKLMIGPAYFLFGCENWWLGELINSLPGLGHGLSLGLGPKSIFTAKLIKLINSPPQDHFTAKKKVGRPSNREMLIRFWIYLIIARYTIRCLKKKLAQTTKGAAITKLGGQTWDFRNIRSPFHSIFGIKCPKSDGGCRYKKLAGPGWYRFNGWDSSMVP